MRRILILLAVVGCEGSTTTPPAAAEPAPEPKPVYTSAVCCVTGRTCELDDAKPLAADCACDDLQGHVC